MVNIILLIDVEKLRDACRGLNPQPSAWDAVDQTTTQPRPIYFDKNDDNYSDSKYVRQSTGIYLISTEIKRKHIVKFSVKTIQRIFPRKVAIRFSILNSTKSPATVTETNDPRNNWKTGIWGVKSEVCVCASLALYPVST